MSKGKINQVIGPVVDFKFETGQLPDQGHAIELKDQQGKKLVFEVFQGLILFYLLGAELLVNFKLEFSK